MNVYVYLICVEFSLLWCYLRICSIQAAADELAELDETGSTGDRNNEGGISEPSMGNVSTVLYCAALYVAHETKTCTAKEVTSSMLEPGVDLAV